MANDNIIEVQQPGLTFWERIYIVAVARGVLLTSQHFFRNMAAHIGHLFGKKQDVRGSVTIQYPEQKRDHSSRLRTRHRLMERDDGSTRCVGCMMCETICPARCIYIVAEEHPDPNIEKIASTFDIDLGKCVFCGYCVEACPEDAIRMDTGILEIAAFDRTSMILNIDDLMHPENLKPPPAEPVT